MMPCWVATLIAFRRSFVAVSSDAKESACFSANDCKKTHRDGEWRRIWQACCHQSYLIYPSPSVLLGPLDEQSDFHDAMQQQLRDLLLHFMMKKVSVLIRCAL